MGIYLSLWTGFIRRDLLRLNGCTRFSHEIPSKGRQMVLYAHFKESWLCLTIWTKYWKRNLKSDAGSNSNQISRIIFRLISRWNTVVSDFSLWNVLYFTPWNVSCFVHGKNCLALARVTANGFDVLFNFAINLDYEPLTRKLISEFRLILQDLFSKERWGILITDCSI